MNPRKILIPAALSLGLLVLGAPAVDAGDIRSQSASGNTFFNASPPCPVKQFPTFESIAPIPGIVDPFEDDVIPFFCQIRVDKRPNVPRKNAKGMYTTEVVVRNNNTGSVQSFPVDSGRFKTNANGFDSFDFEIPTEIFADGFESGDVSAWSYTRADFTNKKKASGGSLNCGTSTSKSGN